MNPFQWLSELFANISDLIDSFSDLFPGWLGMLVELLIYAALFTALMLIPMAIWLGFAIASTSRQQREAG